MDKAPKLSIGAINPYALTETLLGRKIDWSKKKLNQNYGGHSGNGLQ
ncbi:hypothetical protein [Hyunsoonleella pacifica]|nr:hypothetical protein [Hyunsoonleella pacifica]GGD08919.1 hypothetical protein GCM10011368_08570 [Hyunsoonleella pacifica]